MDFQIVDAAWAQAYLTGAAILVSGVLAVLVPYWERRAARRREEFSRLNITTTRGPSGGLSLEIAYLPAFTSMGFFASVSVVSPRNARLVLGRPVTNPAPFADTGAYVRHEMAGQFISLRGRVPLLRLGDDDVFTAVLFLLPPEGSEKSLQSAQIRIRVLTSANGELLSHELIVSPIDDPGI